MSLMHRMFGRVCKSDGFVLALGGGGGRGLAHLGVFEALEEHGLVPKAIVGTSIGALFGALYAVNPDAKAAKQAVLEVLDSELFASVYFPPIADVDVDDQSWLSRLSAAARQSVLFARAAMDIAMQDNQPLIQVAREFCDGNNFADCVIPLYVTAVNFPSGKCQLFSQSSGVELALALAASTAVPGVFMPVEIDGQRFVDGGLASELPTMEAEKIAKPGQLVVAVNVGAQPDPGREPTNVIGMLDWAAGIKSLYLRRHNRKHAGLLIEPIVGDKQWHDFSRPEEEIERGRQTALESMPELLKLLGR